jgi:DNA polymerase III delta subunit
MKDGKITVIFDDKVASRFARISRETKWEDKVIVQEAIEWLCEKYENDKDKTILEITKRWRKLNTGGDGD